MTLPKHIFIISLLITIVVFIGGLFLGWNLDSYRTSDLLTELRQNELDTESYLIEDAFWESYGGEDCNFVELRLNSISLQLVELGQDLNSYQNKNIFHENEFQYLARRYFLLEIKGYVLYNDLKKKCDLDNDVILFFYSSDDDDSEKQGFVLDRIVETTNGTVDIFSISKDFEGDQTLETIKRYYNITMTPTIIINSENKMEGYVSYTEIESALAEDTN